MHSKILVTFRASLDGQYDGVTRILTDAQRFGFGLRRISCLSKADGATRVKLVMELPGDTDLETVRRRFNRHPTVLSVELASGRTMRCSEKNGVAK